MLHGAIFYLGVRRVLFLDGKDFERDEIISSYVDLFLRGLGEVASRS